MLINFWHKDKHGYIQGDCELTERDLKKILRVVKQRMNELGKKELEGISAKKIWLTLHVVD